MPDIQPVFTLDAVAQRIFELRGQRVMLDSDLAVLYGVETGALVRAAKRNPKRFPEDFMFQLSSVEWASLRCQNGTSNLRSQNGISNGRGGRRYAPYAFSRLHSHDRGAASAAQAVNTTRASRSQKNDF